MNGVEILMKKRRMTKRKAYKGIYDTPINASDYDVFFAFGTEQYKKALEKNGFSDEQIVSAGDGLYGTRDGLKAYFGAFEKLTERVAAECNPQDIYRYEFDNHDCEHICCDREAMKYVVSIFGMERAKKVKRRYGYISIEEIEEEIYE